MCPDTDPANTEPFIFHVPNITIESTDKADHYAPVPAGFSHSQSVTTLEFQACARNDIVNWGGEHYEANAAKCAAQGANLPSGYKVWAEA